MVKDENVPYCIAKQFVQNFLATNASQETLDAWLEKSNLKDFQKKMTKKKTLPLRPKSKYIYFCEINRPAIKEEMMEKCKDGNMKVNIHDITCELGKRWKQFSTTNSDPEMMQKIENMAKEDNNRYHQEKKAMFTKKHNENNHLRSVYLFYCREQRQINPKIDMSTLGKLWKKDQNDPGLLSRYDLACKERNYTPKKNQQCTANGIVVSSQGGVVSTDIESL
jgi:hypothetical protein